MPNWLCQWPDNDPPSVIVEAKTKTEASAAAILVMDTSDDDDVKVDTTVPPKVTMIPRNMLACTLEVVDLEDDDDAALETFNLVPSQAFLDWIGDLEEVNESPDASDGSGDLPDPEPGELGDDADEVPPWRG